jgi:predicted small lipoprotein YifL
MRHRFAVPALLAVMILLVAGCGGAGWLHLVPAGPATAADAGPEYLVGA